jgi:hypothetical protein
MTTFRRKYMVTLEEEDLLAKLFEEKMGDLVDMSVKERAAEITNQLLNSGIIDEHQMVTVTWTMQYGVDYFVLMLAEARKARAKLVKGGGKKGKK